MPSKSQAPRTIDAVCAFAYSVLAVGWSFGTWVQWGRGEYLLASLCFVLVLGGVLLSASYSYRYIRDARRQKAESRTLTQNTPNAETADSERV